MDSRRIKALKHRARRLSIKEGIFASARGSFGDHYLSPFAIAINTSSSLVAMLSAISGLLGPVSQIFGSGLMGKESRKKIIAKAVFLESLIWIPMILIAILFQRGIITSTLPILMLSIFAIYVVLSNWGSPAWFSWMGDLVEENKRGRWFSKRNLIIGFTSITLALAASFFLDSFKSRNWTLYGFMILFFLAFLSRLESWRTIRKQYEPKMKINSQDYFSFWSFIKKAPKTNFGKFSIFRASLSLAGSISAPLLAVYLLRNLGFSYSTYMIVTLSGSALSLLVLEFWGDFADKYGNCLVMRLTSIPIALIPLLWILSPSPLYLVLIPSIIGGIAWAGFGLSAGNFIYDNVQQDKRGLAVSYYNMLNGIGTFLGAGVGAILIKTLNTVTITPIFIIFIIGTLARLIVMFTGIFKIKEVRPVKKLKGRRDFGRVIYREVKPTLLEEFHQIKSIRGRIFEK